MPFIVTEFRDDGLGHAVEVVVAADRDSSVEYPFFVDVPEGATALVLAVSNDESPKGVSGPGPERVTVIVGPPDGVRVNQRMVYSSNGLGATVVLNPPAGRWRVMVVCPPRQRAMVNAAAYKPTFFQRLRGFGGRFACRSCTVFLKPLVVAAIVHLVVAALPAATVAAATAVLSPVFGGMFAILIPAEFVAKFVEILLGYADHPLDHLVTGGCRLIRACA
ncbi:MAG: hypothetical protein LAO08_00445 [Acidobacteriia bacterium]|nr:hypothetical protein [Terriglobia bacterium]